MLDRIDDRAAYDDGATGGTTLPNTELVNGRYAPTVDGVHRGLFRRAGGAWAQVGGNSWAETQYERAGAALPVTGAARVRSHPTLAAATVTENWDGSSVRGGRQAIGDVNAAQPGAVHVGDLAAAVDLAVRGRVYARAGAAGERGFVATAGVANAGNLFTARDSGGSEPWLVDAVGRMRAQAPTAFGAAALAAGVPVSAAPGASDLSAMDLYAATGKPSLRLFRAAGDLVGSFGADAIALGKAGWTGGSISLTAPTLTLTGAVGVTGALTASGKATVGSLDVNGVADLDGNTTVGGTLGVAGQATLAGVAASSLSVSGDLAANGRLRLPTSNPSGTAAGQIRAKPSPDWGSLEVYDGSAWKGQFSGTGRKHEWHSIGTTLGHNVETTVTSMVKKSGSASIVTSETGGWFRLNRVGLWTMRTYFYTDGATEGQVANYVTWEDGDAAPFGFVMIDRRARRLNGNSGQLDSTVSWTGYVDAAAAAARFKLVGYQYATSGGSSYLTCSLYMEYLGA